jgi:predicted porin
LKANFFLESGITDNTALTFGGRGYWVGLEDAKMGQLRFGRQNSFARDVWLGADQLAAANVVGNLAHSTVLATDISTSAHTDFNTAVNYLSPSMNGFKFNLGLTKNTVETNGVKVDTGSGEQASVSFESGKFRAAAAHSRATTNTSSVNGTDAVYRQAVTTSGGSTLVSGTFTLITPAVAATAATNVETKNTAAALTYDLGFATAAYIYNETKAVNAVSSTTTSNIDRKSNSFSLSAPLTPKLIARVGYGFGTYQSGGPTAYKGDVSGTQAALNYNLSKRTTTYVIYGTEERDASATQTNKAKEYSLGVRHSF